jgi:hypothetical protein
MHCISTFFYMEAKFGPLQKRIENYWHQLRWKFSKEQPGTFFLTIMEGRSFESVKVESRTSRLETKIYKSNLLWHVTRMNRSSMPKVMLNCRPNGQTTWNNLEETIRRKPEQSHQGLTRDEARAHHRSWICRQKPTAHTTNTVEPLRVVLIKYESTQPDDGSCVIRNMLK